MASPAVEQSAVSDTYERNKVNNLCLGPAFEANVAIYWLLTLSDDRQGLAFEYKAAPAKFDDVVLRVRREKNDYEYHYFQLKHRDTGQDQDACLTWNDLLTAKNKSKFGIPFYYECLAEPRRATLTGVKELAFVTNFNLVKQGCTGLANDLETLARQLLNPSGKDRNADCFVTEGDVMKYFQECDDLSMTWRPPSAAQKSYRFTATALDAIEKGTSAGYRAANKPFDSSAYREFLRLLVFRVGMPCVNKLEEINQQLLKIFLPFYKNVLGDNYKRIKRDFMQLFEPVQNAGIANSSVQGTSAVAASKQCTAIWANLERRHSVLERLTSCFKAKVSIGSRENYEIGTLIPNFEILDFARRSFDEEPHWLGLINKVFGESTSWAKRQPHSVVNIHSTESNATMLILNILLTLKNSLFYSEHAWQTLSVREEADIKNLVAYFKELEKEVSEYTDLIKTSFCCVIEVSPLFHPTDKAEGLVRKMAQTLVELFEMRKWMQIVLVTQSPICTDVEFEDFKSIEGNPLKWDDLSDGGKNYLLEKTLYLENDIQTSLQKLGFKQETMGEWLNTKSLAELIVHDKQRPLSLGLPKRDPDLQIDYIEREIQLPLMKKTSARRKMGLIAYSEDDFSDEKYYLLHPANSKRSAEFFLWVKSKEGRSIFEFHNDIIRSKYSDVTVNEWQLLEDKVKLGTGSNDNKLVVVVDLPGKGKSCLLTSLSNQFLDEWDNNQPAHRLLLRVDLLRIKDWDAYHDRPMELFLKNSLACSDDCESELNYSVAKEKCLNAPEPSVFVLLDGFDEISDDQRKTTLKIIDSLLSARGIKRIILTSRPENTLETELEEHFKQLSLHLKNFDRQDQINYLMKRWRADLKNRYKRETSDEKIRIFVETLVDYAETALRHEDRTFLEIPLQCMILSTCFYAQLEQYLESGLEPEFDEANFEILNLYDRFYDVKFEVLFEEKAELHCKNEVSVYLKRRQKNSFSKSIMRLSVFHMMNDIEDAQVLCCVNWDDYRSGTSSEYSEDLKAAMKLGLVQGSKNETSLSDLEPRLVRFLHRTLSEYFCASFFAGHLIETKSKLWDNDSFLRQDIVDKCLEVFNDKILVAAEYAGVRRFLDRMLAEYVPPVGELCPFAKEKSRLSAFKKWPVIGHEKLNNHFANCTEFELSPMFGRWSKDELENTNLFQLIDRDLTLSTTLELQQEGLKCFLQGSANETLPSISSMLINCLKEYACRPDITDTDRERFAYFFMLISVSWTKTGNLSQLNLEVLSSVFHMFDRVSDLSDATNNVFSKWFFKLITDLTDDPSEDVMKLEFLASMYEILKNHRDAPQFDETLKTIVSSLFEENDTGEIKTAQFFKVELGEEDRMNTWGETLRTILCSISECWDAIENPLFTHLTDWFTAKLAKHGALVNDQSALIYRFFSVDKDECSIDVFESNVRAAAKYFLHPFALEETIEFLLENASKLSRGVTIEGLLSDALNYVHKAELLLAAIIFKTDFEYLSGLRTESASVESLMHNVRHGASFSMFWYHWQIDKIIVPHLTDGEKIKQQLASNRSFCGLDRKCLIAFAHAECCCECENPSYSGLGIHFPCDLYESEDCRETFENLFADKLKVVWQGKGEIEFIDYLLKENVTSSSENINKNEESTQVTVETNPDSIMRGTHLAKLPCLLFSDLVSQYVPRGLSAIGLQHLEVTLKRTPLFTNRRRCFLYSFTAESLVISDTKKSLWDGIMQADETTLATFTCQSDRIKVFRNALEIRREKML